MTNRNLSLGLALVLALVLFSQSTGAQDPSDFLQRPGPGVTQVHAETPAGAIDSANTIYTLAIRPVAGSLVVHHNGLRLKQGVDYNLSGTTFTFINGVVPQTGDTVIADYRR